METSKQSLTIKFLEIREIWDENADLKLALVWTVGPDYITQGDLCP